MSWRRIPTEFSREAASERARKPPGFCQSEHDHRNATRWTVVVCPWTIIRKLRKRRRRSNQADETDEEGLAVWTINATEGRHQIWRYMGGGTLLRKARVTAATNSSLAFTSTIGDRTQWGPCTTP